MLDIWQAVRLDEVKRVGRTKPLVIECRRTGDAPAPANRLLLVKAMGLPEAWQQRTPRIRSHLLAVRDHVSEFGDQLRESLR